MIQYIDKAALVAEIERLDEEKQAFYASDVLYDLEAFIDTLETKEVDLDKEFEWFLDEVEGVPRMWHSDEQIEWAKDIAKHFFELGLQVNNPITAVDRGMTEEILINLKRVEQDYHIDLTREMEWLRKKTRKEE